MDAQGEDARLGVSTTFAWCPTLRATTLLRTFIAIPSLFARGFHFEADGLVVDVVPATKVCRCGECGGMATRVHDRRLRYWRHLDVGGMTLRVRYAIRRVFCPSCNAVKTERVPWAGPSSNFTYEFEERVAYLAQQSSKTAVRKLMRVSWVTVGAIVDRVVSRHLDKSDDRLDGLRHIGVDELSYRRHHEYVTVVVDHETSRVVWAARGKNAKTLRAFFEDLGGERREKIESVTIDMSGAYISAVEAELPHARLIFDRFHVQRLVQDAVDETRRDEVRGIEDKEERKALKNTRYTVLKGPWNLTNTDLETLEQLEEANRDIFRAYLLKESFAAILDRRQVNVARRKIEQWIGEARASGLQHFVRVAGTIEKHLDGILEYVRTGFSNGRTEGLNGKIRTITRRSFGFHSATALISMIFLCCGGVHVTPAFSTPIGSH